MSGMCRTPAWVFGRWGSCVGQRRGDPDTRRERDSVPVLERAAPRHVLHLGRAPRHPWVDARVGGVVAGLEPDGVREEELEVDVRLGGAVEVHPDPAVDVRVVGRLPAEQREPLLRDRVRPAVA